MRPRNLAARWGAWPACSTSSTAAAFSPADDMVTALEPRTRTNCLQQEKSFSKSKSKSMTENSTFSTESSRASSASSSCSSLSPLANSKPVQQKLPCINEKHVVARSRTMRSSRSFKSSDTEVKSIQQKTDFRDVVKDSINQDSRVLAIKTKMMEQRDGLHKDSPRPLLISKSTDGTYVIAVDRSNVPPAYVNESSRQQRLSCDDRQLLLQVEAQDSKMPSSKHMELPRLSLDSRNESVKSSLHQKNFGYARTDDSLIDNLKYQESPSHRRASAVVAKLMGLEETLDAPGSARSHRPDRHTRNNYLPHTSRSICHDLSTLQPKIQPTILKTKPSPRIVPEAAAWKQQKINTARYYSKEGPSSTSINDNVERLINLTSSECSKDLRALRILSELHAKRSDYNARSLNTQKAAAGQTNSAQHFQSPVVIMKPARGIVKKNASVATLAGTKVHRKLRHEESTFTTKTDNSDRTKTHSHNQRAHSRREEDVGSTSSPKPSRILSPRLVRKSDCGRITQLTVPLMSPAKTSKEVSPRGKLRSRASQSNSICGHDKAMITESKISLSKQVDTNIINYSNTLNVNTTSIHQSNTTSTSNYEETLILCTDKNIHPLENIPSPVSVLDATFYQDVMSPSLRGISNSFKNVAPLTLHECWNSISLPDTPTLKKSTESNHIIPENMKALIQKLELLQLLSDEAPRTNDNSLILTANKDRHYIYEILSASGLLHNELKFRIMPCLFQQPSHPINPELFLILEQAKPTAGKLHRKLIFDLAIEIIAKKIYSGSSVRQPLQFIQCKKSSGWHLFKELCSEIEMLRSEASAIRLSEEEDEESKLAKNAIREMGKWKSFGSELQGIALGIERSIFKNLIDEVISGEDMGKV
ncbi:protein LONGIFOLIA 1 isoform X3 [Sorghum bicolor]|nr:protein LONGIFOLIA 1 isoform X3 [Sorghum bicolor]|eukprot:XP_021307644.1 protein LONGIFOLIA 1 isoform X3 [Sorghum bicolor]